MNDFTIEERVFLNMALSRTELDKRKAKDDMDTASRIDNESYDYAPEYRASCRLALRAVEDVYYMVEKINRSTKELLRSMK